MSHARTIALIACSLLCWTARAAAQPVDRPPRSDEPAPGAEAPASAPGAAPGQQPQQEPEQPRLVRPPQLKALVPAELPPGTDFPAPAVEVLLSIEVDAGGAVTGVRVEQGPGEPFDSAARRAAEQFRFEPALLSNGEQVPVSITFRMRITEPPPPPPPPVQFDGRLLERGTRSPLAGVEVVALAVRPSAEPAEAPAEAGGEGGGEGGPKMLAQALTDDQGRFSLAVPAERFLISARPPGHEQLEAEVVAAAGEQREEVFYLESVGGRFETVVRSERTRREVTRQVIRKEVVERLPGTQGDTLKVVQNLPGTARAPFLGGQLILRGASPGDSRIFLEGQEIPILYHFGALRSTFNSAFLEAVEFIPGNFGPQYGRAMGGIIDVRVRDPAADMFRGEIDINLYDAGFRLEGPLSDNWSVGGAFHRSWVDTFISALVPADANLSFDTAPRYYDYQLLATWKPDANRKLRLLGYGSLDKLALLFDEPAGDPKIRGSLRGRIMFHALQGAYLHRFSPALSQETSLQFGYQEIRTDIGPELFFNLGIWRLSLRSGWSYQALDWLTVRAGLDMRLEWVELEANSPLRPIEGEQAPPVSTQQVFGVSERTTLFEPAVFAELEFRPLDALQITPSLRVDYYRNIDRWTFDPRLMARYEVHPGTVLKGGVGYYQQPPAADQAVEELGNPKLEALRSSHSSLGIEQTVIDGLSVELAGFYKWLDRQVIRNPVFFADPAAPPYINGGTGRILGLELLVKARLGGFQGWLAYTYQRSYRSDGPGAEERPFDFDQPHILTAVGSYRIGWGITAGLRFQLVSGNPATPVVGAIYDANSDTWVPLFGPTNSERLPLFHQLDVRVDKEFVFDRWKLALYLEVINLYNQGNAEGFQYNFDYSERQRLTGLPVLPILGIQGEW